MPEHATYVDPIFGASTWNDAEGEWLFNLTFPSGRSIEGRIRPDDNSLHLSSPQLQESRACVYWVQANELALKQYVADKMYARMLDWHNPEWGPPLTKDEFREKLALEGVNVLEDHRALLHFSDAECFGGHALVFTVGADGELDEEPHLWG